MRHDTRYSGNKYPVKPVAPAVNTPTSLRVLQGALSAKGFAQVPANQSEKDLIGDAFASLYLHNPQTMDEVPPTRKATKELMDWLINDQSFDNSATAGNPVASLGALVKLWESLLESQAVKDALEEQEKVQEILNQCDQCVNQAQSQQQDQDGDEPNDQDGDNPAVNELLAKAEAMSAMADALGERAKQKIQDVKGQFLGKQIVQRANEKSKDAGEKIKQVMVSWGMDENDPLPENLDPIDLLDMTNSQRYQQFADLLGRARDISYKQVMSTVQSNLGQVLEPDMTHDPYRVSMTERTYLSPQSPTLIRAEKTMQLIEGGGLFGYRPRSAGKKSGSFVGLMDESGSMSHLQVQTGKSIMLAIAQVIKDQFQRNRTYELYGFGGRPLIELGVTDQNSWYEHMMWASSHANLGNTRFDTALDWAMDRIEDMILEDNDLGGVDILMITDGISMITDEVEERIRKIKAEVGTRLIIVQLRSGQMWDERLEELSDLIIRPETHTVDLETMTRLITEVVTEHELENF